MTTLSPHLFDGPSLGSLYRQAFKTYADRQAIVGGQTSLSYHELEARCHQLVRYLESLGLRPQDGLALLSGNNPDAVVTIIATQLMGLRLTPLHPLGSEEDQAFVLQDASIRVLVVDSSHYGERGLALQRRGIVEHVLTMGPAAYGTDMVEGASRMDASDTPLTARSQDICKISYTGGTTGRSKGVMHAHRTSVTMLLQQLSSWEWPENVRFLAATPLSHAAGAYVLPTFLRGGTVFFMDKYTPEAYLRQVQEHGITCSFLVPSQIYGLLDCHGFGQYDTSSLQRLWYGASPIAPSRLAEAIRKLGPILGQIYGQAEAPMTITYLRSDEHDLERPHLLGSCGRVVPGNEVKLLDEILNEVPAGEIGELCVRGPLVMAGYLNRPEENASALAGGWLHTGDMARQDAEGFIYLIDRAKDMIISGGFNVYSSEVENCLAQHPAVACSAVIGTPDPKWGEVVTALVVLKPGAQAQARELMSFVSERKGSVVAPKKIEFTDHLPLTAIGKVDKKTIRSKYWAGQQRQVG